jgi:hypothetical protein
MRRTPTATAASPVRPENTSLVLNFERSVWRMGLQKLVAELPVRKKVSGRTHRTVRAVGRPRGRTKAIAHDRSWSRHTSVRTRAGLNEVNPST